MNARKITISPKYAAELLQNNTINRPLRNVVVARYAKAMQDGAWDFNGETIKIARSGQLLDGQHRLQACVKAGISFTTLLIDGLDESTFSSIDRCEVRKTSDDLHMTGNKNCAILSGAILLAWQISRKTIGYADPIRPDIALKVVDKYPQIRDHAGFAVAMKKRSLISPTVCAGFSFVFSMVDEELCCDFFDKVINGEMLAHGMPELALRNKLIDNKESRNKLSRPLICRTIIKAWNAKYKKSAMAIIKILESESNNLPIAGLDYEKFNLTELEVGL